MRRHHCVECSSLTKPTGRYMDDIACAYAQSSGTERRPSTPDQAPKPPGGEKKDNHDKNKISPINWPQQDSQTRININPILTQLPLKLIANPWGRPCRRAIKLHHMMLQTIGKVRSRWPRLVILSARDTRPSARPNTLLRTKRRGLLRDNQAILVKSDVRVFRHMRRRQ